MRPRAIRAIRSTATGQRWLGRASLPTTPAGVEQSAVMVFLGVRFVNLLQLAVTLPSALGHTARPVLFTAVLTGFAAESVLIAVVTVRAGRYRDRRWGWADTAVAVLVLLAQPAFTTAEDITGDWTAWGFACTLSTAVGASIVFARRREVGFAVAILMICYLATALSGAQPGSTRATVLGNAFAYPGFALLSRLLVGYLRRLAADADAARMAAAQAAAEAARMREVQRQRLLLHDNISVLHMLARPDLPEELGEALKAQAVVLANRVRTFLDDAADRIGADATGRIGWDGARQRPLTAIVRDAVAAYPDLRVETSLDLAAGVTLPEPAAEALRDAVGTVLSNVRLHACASRVVVHADADPDEDEWELTVTDDGRGFDPAATPYGFGLRVQVEQTLAAHGISTHVHSVPGDGTRVTVRGCLTAVDPASRSPHPGDRP
ncbi:ATP-binding protein [Micromonospora sp. B11E3]|uniref:ATP-binding protein n=1 Tax=Micromonospora sp. B11E3 TaxID=3153562 RepID=UPI00325CD452